MTDHGMQSVRASVVGADRGFQVLDGGKGRRGDGPPPSAPPDGDDGCPVVALGHCGGTFHFLDKVGQKRELSARQIGSRQDIMGLFFDDAWLRRQFPKKAMVKRKDNDGAETAEEVTVDFQINRASAFLIAECGRAGLYGEHVVLRRPGVWPGPDGLPVVHCGDVVLEAGQPRPAGSRSGGQVWAAAPPTPRPATPCGAEVRRDLQAALQQLWNFKLGGAAVALLGLLGTAFLGAVPQWRPAGFLCGGAGSGKSSLLTVLRACTPLHQYSNDTTKSGLETALNSRAMPSFIDETSDADDQRGARRLLDLVLTSSGGEGTKGMRGGGEDGRGRQFEVAGTIIMASINPPEMKPQHMGRFTLVELLRGEAGVNHRVEHDALAARMRKVAPALWGRAVASVERYRTCQSAFGLALGRAGCDAREMDQVGALLSGWWILTEEGDPSEKQAREGVEALRDFIRGAAAVELDDAPRRMLQHLLSKTVQMDRSTARAQIGALIERMLVDPKDDRGDMAVNDYGRANAKTALAHHGIRAIGAWDVEKDGRGRSAPRAAQGDGVWFGMGASELRSLFDGTDFEGTRWQFELKRLETAREPKKNVFISPGYSGRAVWVSAEELRGDDPEDIATL